MYCMELTVEHDLGHDCMELNQGKHGDESENHAVLVIFVMVFVST